ncbi:MAG: hypothetical protein ACKOS8_02245, partial [Gemmataceae bacterium]
GSESLQQNISSIQWSSFVPVFPILTPSPQYPSGIKLSNGRGLPYLNTKIFFESTNNLGLGIVQTPF